MINSKKPTNHVTEAMAELRMGGKGSAGNVPPHTPEDLLEWLKAVYPPRCYDPASENLEAHLKYAGAVELIETLTAANELRDRGLLSEEDI